MKKMIALILSLAIMGGTFTGCSNGNGSTQPNPSQNTKEDAPASAEAEKMENKRTDFVVALNAKFSNYDPFESSITEQVRFNYVIFDRLYTYSSQEAILSPMLATDYTVSDDGLTWTFKLRDDVTFHDGSKLTAKDVKLSFEKAQASPYKGASLKMIDSVEEVDEHTVNFNMKYYYSASLESISDVVIVPSSVYAETDTKGFSNNLIGSGPFKLKSIDNATGNIEVERNDSYWGNKSELEKISFRVISDPSTRVVSLEKGEIDFCDFLATDYDIIKGKEKLQIIETFSTSYPILVFNTEKEPTNDVKFRQALAYALDYEAINLVSNGNAPSNINTVLYKEFYGFVPEGVKEYQYDPEKAKALLEEIGLSLPYNLGVMQTTSRNKSICETIQQNLRSVGIEIEIEVAEQGTYINNVLSGNYLLLFMPGSNPGLNPVQVLNSLLSREKIGSSNLGRYSNDEMEELLQGLSLSKNDVEKQEYIQKIVELAQEELPVVKLYDSLNLSACSADLNPSVSIGDNYNFAQFTWK